MLNLLWALSFVLLGVQAADHNIFKSCAEIELCNSLRNKIPDAESAYTADLSNIEIVEGEVIIPLNNAKGSQLLLKLTGVLDGQFRLIIIEPDSNRYHLVDALDGEPETRPLQVIDKFDKLVFIAENSSSENQAVILSDPLSISFSHKDDIQVMVIGDRIIMQNSSFAFELSFYGSEQLYGIHEHCDSLALQNTSLFGTDPYRLRNLDVSEFELYSPMALYGSIPVLYGHGKNKTAGVYLNNAVEQWYDISNYPELSSAYVMVGGGVFDLFVLLGPTPQEVVRQYTSLTGKAHLPQLWTLGHHQSRWSYMSQDEAQTVVQNFVNYNFPLDVIWLDIDYTNGMRYFTWNPETFPDPIGLQQNISAVNKKVVVIIDPHIKKDEGYEVYAQAKEKGLFVKNSDGSDFVGQSWPGDSSYMDFLNPEARDFYGSWYSYDKFNGSTDVIGGIWNDMNEPSVWDNDHEITMTADQIHHGGVSHDLIHNIYGLLHTKATHEGLLKRDSRTKRPFVLSRSHFAGTQRYSAIWTGDNHADWGYLKLSVPECLNANLLGIVFCGSDVGGFSSNPVPELLQRWYQAGAWQPFYRAHSSQGTDYREPYLFDDQTQTVIRNAIKLRYKHIPIWYTLFYEHTRNGDPVIRPLWYHYPSDSETFRIDSTYLLGSNVLIAPVSESNVKSIEVYLPGGPEEIWYQIDQEGTAVAVFKGTGATGFQVDINMIPVLYRGGSIILRKDNVKGSTADMLNDPYTAYVNLDINGKAESTFYIDDFTSFKYVDEKSYAYLSLTYNSDNQSIEATNIDSNPGSGDFKVQIETVVVNSMSSKGLQTRVFRKNLKDQIVFPKGE